MVEERVLGDVGVACCFHKKCYQKILRQKSCTVNIKWHISVFSMGKRISSKNKQIACSSTYLPSIDSRGSHSMQFQGCRNQGGQGAIVPPTYSDRKAKRNELLLFTTEPPSCIIFRRSWIYALLPILQSAHSCKLYARLLPTEKEILTCGRPASEKGCVTLKGNSCAKSVAGFTQKREWISGTTNKYLLWFLLERAFMNFRIILFMITLFY